MSQISGWIGRRCAGVLLHPSSLPGPGDFGTLGVHARRFVDFLSSCGFSVWQTLPLGLPDSHGSPYQSSSAHAGNTALIDFDALVACGWLRSGDLDGTSVEARIAEAQIGFGARATEAQRIGYATFVVRHGRAWLDDYALFSALHEMFGVPWWEWPDPYRNHDAAVLAGARIRMAERIDILRFAQYLFFSQWQELKSYAARKGIDLFGDIPIFVARNSADVWAARKYFQIDAQGVTPVVAGVPPDYFSETGQRWGNPLYDWDALRQDGFSWWLDRIRTQLELFDILRIDHFRGLEAYWEIPADQPTAIHGRWVQAPGRELLTALQRKFDRLPLVAEDLGVITPEVTALRDAFDLPGMSVAQFAFDGSVDNPHLPHLQRENSVIYTGTHDNDTTLAWFNALHLESRTYVLEYLSAVDEDMPQALIRAVWASASRLAVIPMQDLLGLGSGHRMNTPGLAHGNWRWRFAWEDLPHRLESDTRSLLEKFDRCVAD